MHYTAETFAQYDALFRDAHAALTKEAGALDWMGRRFAKRVHGAAPEGSIGSRILERFRNPQAKQVEAALAAQKDEAARALAQQQDFSRQILHQRDAAQAAQTGYRAEIGTLEKQIAEQAEQAAQAAPRSSAGLKTLAGIGLAGVPAAGAGGYYGGQYLANEEAEKQRLRTRNLAFGTGAAAGIAAPHVIQGLGRIARGARGTGLFPDMPTMGTY